MIYLILPDKHIHQLKTPEIFVGKIRVRSGDGQRKVVSKVKITRLHENNERQCLLEGEWTEFDKLLNLLFTASVENVVKVDGRNGSCN